MNVHEIRKVSPYDAYDKVEFDVPVGKNGDCCKLDFALYDSCEAEINRRSVLVSSTGVQRIVTHHQSMLEQDASWSNQD